MKKSKKILSLVLSLLIALSCVSVSFIAFAATDTKTQAVQDVEAKLTEFLAINTNLGAAKPAYPEAEDPKFDTKKAAYERYEAAFKLYNEINPMYKALSEDERDSIDISLALKYFQKLTAKEAYEIRTAHDNALPEGSTSADKMSYADSMEAAQAKMDSLIGPQKARDEALKVGENLFTSVGKDKTGKDVYLSTFLKFNEYPDAAKVLENYITDYKKASDLARMYLDGIGSNGLAFSMSGIGGKLRDIVKMDVQKKTTLGEIEFDGGTKPTSPKKPSASSYPGGTADPDYIAALKVYTQEKEVYVAYNVNQYNWKADAAFTSLKKITSGVSQFKDVYNTIELLRSGVDDLVKNSGTELAQKAIDTHDKLSEYEQKTISALSIEAYSYYYPNSTGDDFSSSNLQISQLYKKCLDAANLIYVNNFTDYINSVDLAKVDNDVVAKALEEYQKVPSSVRGNISAETLEKYNAILALYVPIGPNTPLDYDFAKEIKEHNENKTKVELPDSKNATEAGINATMDSLEELIYTLLESKIPGFTENGKIAGLLENGVYTNATMGTILGLYDTINNSEIYADIMGASVNIAPLIGSSCCADDLMALIPEEKFSKAYAKLEACKGEDGKYTTSDYASITWASGDWGFEDGDQEGFKTALLASLRPVTNMIQKGISVVGQLLQLPNYIAANGDYCYGAYELLLPALESIGLDVPSSAAYTENYKNALAKSYPDSLDALISPLVDAIFKVVDEFAEAPLDTLVKYLPQAAYTIDSGLLDKSVKAALGTSSILGGLTSSLDLSADGVNKMLTAAPIAIAIDDETTLNIQLKAIDWKALAGCSTADKASSVMSTNLYRVGLESDTVSTFTTVFYYLYDVIFEDSNYASLKTAINKLMPMEAPVIIGLTTTLKAMGPVNSYGMLLDLLAGDGELEPEEPTTEKPTTDEPTTDKPATGDENGNNQDTSNPDIPKTGAKIAVLSSAVAAIGVASAVFVISRKKYQD